MENEKELKVTSNLDQVAVSIKNDHPLKFELLFYGKLFILLSAGFSLIWLVGYLQINILWGIIGILTFVIYQCTINKQHQKFNFGMNLSSDIKYTIDNIPNLPSWVYFPDVERVEWINKIILRLWPSITVFCNKIIRDVILRKIQKKLKGLKLKDIYFGDIPPKIGGVKIYDNENINRNEIIMDIDIYYFSPAEITFIYNQIPFGIKNFEVKGNVRIQINSLIPQIPFFGAISITLLQNPHINFEFTDVVSIFNMPGLRSLLKESVDDVIAAMMVLPNRINIIIKDDINKAKFMFHVPEGVLRIHVIEASALKAMDIRIFEHNTSDPYMIIRVGAEKFKTKVVNNNLNPKWDETFEAIVDTKSCQTVKLELYDKDKNNKDDFLGKVSFDVQSVYDRGIFDTWLQLEEVDTGSVHLNLTWLNLSNDPDAFDLEEDRLKFNERHFNIGFIYLSVDSAKNLYKPSVSEDPDPVVKVSLGNQTEYSSVKKKTTNPVWENQFHFMIQSLLSSVIYFQVKDEKSKKILGTCSLKVESLRNEPNMAGFFTLKLENSNGCESTIQLYVVLRALLAKKTRTSTLSRMASVRLSPRVPESISETNNNDNNNMDTETDVKSDSSEDVFDSSISKSVDKSLNLKPERSSNSLSNDSPRVHLTLRYTANRNMFIVAIHRIENIKADHGVYVKLAMHPKDNRNSKRRTKSIRDSNNLVYDETFEFFCNKETLETSDLILNFKVERHSVIKRNPCIGRTQIDLNEFNPNLIKSNWFPIDTSKNHRNSDTISLASNKSDLISKEKN